MKVVHICSSPKGGAGKAAGRLHKGLNDQPGIESYFLHRDKSYVDTGSKFVYCNLPRKSFIDRALFKTGILKSAEHERKKILSTLPKGEYEIISFPNSDFRVEEDEIIKDADIIHLHWVSGFLDYRRFFQKIGKPIVWTLHDMNPLMGIFHYQGDLRRNNKNYSDLENATIGLKKKGLSRFKSVDIVCLSSWLMEYSRNSELLGRFNHHLIPNGIDFSQYPLNDKQEAARKIGISNTNKTLLFISDDITNHRKGNDLLINTLFQLDKEINLITVGKGNIETPKHVTHFRQGKLDDERKIHDMYLAADLVVLPSREDNLPNVMLESFAAGTPVLSFKTGGMLDWIEEGVNGVFAQEMSAASLALAIMEFCNDKYRFDPLLIRKKAEATFSIKIQVDKYSDLYKKIINSYTK